MMCAEWWGIELTSLLAGTLGMTSLAASSLMLNIINLVYMIPLSLSASITTRIGITLGSGDHRGASAAASLAVLGIAGLTSSFFSFSSSSLTHKKKKRSALGTGFDSLDHAP